MKKFLFIFSLFIFFLFIPKNTFAMSITNVSFYTVDYKLIKSVNLDNYDFKTFPSISNVRRIYFYFDNASSIPMYNYTANVDYFLRSPIVLPDTIHDVWPIVNNSSKPHTFNFYRIGSSNGSVGGIPYFEKEYDLYVNWNNDANSSKFSMEVDLGTDIIVSGVGVPASRLTAVKPVNPDGSSPPDDFASGADILNGVNDIKNSNKENTDKIVDEIDKVDDTLKDDNIDGSKDTASGFFDNFKKENHGLSSIITSPLEFIRSLLGHSCQPLEFELPFVKKKVSLPCIKPIYQKYFGPFFTLWQILTTGLISYAVGIRIFAIVKGLQDPQNDKIEVLKL